MEKKSMQKYCEEMEETIDNKEEMLRTLQSHNQALNRKLSSAASGGSSSDADTELAARKAEESMRRKRRLPPAPKSRASVSSLTPMRASADVGYQELLDRVGKLEATVARLTAELEDANIELNSVRGGDRGSNGEPRPLSVDIAAYSSLREEMDNARLAWEQERADFLARLAASDLEFSELQAVMTETQVGARLRQPPLFWLMLLFVAACVPRRSTDCTVWVQSLNV
jgi:chromosome segregation ATPase